MKYENHAYLFELICEKFDGAELGKKAAQKLFYFFEREGIALNLRYGIHYYGPYSEKLDNIMYYLESENVIKIDDSGKTHVISKGNAQITHNSLSDDDEKCAIQVIEQFAHRSPRELEALATMDYVANNLVYAPISKEKIINKFKEIKGTKFDEATIENTFDELRKLNLITV
ncbi:MAG: hypothetical protein NC393_02335 [Clostridium sp.]|nr:hypothetical protein [Clostridium sp.]MCM1207377.1 hypothetical protein [Ruminococcus sp.]